MAHYTLAKQEDIPQILGMMEEFYLIDQYPFDKIKNEANLSDLIQHPELGLLWLIHSDGELAGYICLTTVFSFEYGGRGAFIDEFYIRERYRNKGMGGESMEFIEKEALKLDFKALHLEVEKHNEAGNRLYEKRGFKNKDRHLLTKMLDSSHDSIEVIS